MLSREVGDRWGTAWALTNLALDLLNQIELGQAGVYSADAALEESEAIWRELGERRHLAFTLKYQAAAAIGQGKLDLARELLEQSMSTLTDLQDDLTSTLWCWAHLFLAQGRYDQAVRVLGASFSRLQRRGMTAPIYRLHLERRLDAARGALGAELVDAAWTEGCAMSLDAAIAYVRQESMVSFPGVLLG